MHAWWCLHCRGALIRMSTVVPVDIAQGDHRETNATWAIYVITKSWFLETSLNKPHLVRLHGDVVH